MPDYQTEALLNNLRLDIAGMIEKSLNTATKTSDNSVNRKTGQTNLDAHLDKLVLDIISAELESTTIPAIEAVVRSMESRMSSTVSAVAAKIAASNATSVSDISSKLRDLESKIDSISRTRISTPQSLPIVAPAHAGNPYSAIEKLVQTGEWEHAFKRAVSVYNGMDFICHLFQQDKAFSVEDFVSRNPVRDSLLALQICVNLAQELVQSDKLVSLKLEMINEIILGVTNTSGLNLSHHFSQLKTLLGQVQNLAGPNSPIYVKIKEVLKISNATERLLTPSPSVANSPAPKYQSQVY
jgi:hypothetical protein